MVLSSTARLSGDTYQPRRSRKARRAQQLTDVGPRASTGEDSRAYLVHKKAQATHPMSLSGLTYSQQLKGESESYRHTTPHGALHHHGEKPESHAIYHRRHNSTAAVRQRCH
jgi:hypothetical protein